MLSLAFLITFVASLAMTGIIRVYLVRHHIIDIPGARSSHVIPTPRGGGVSFVLICLLIIPWLCFEGFIGFRETMALWGAGFIVAVTGFIDDYRSVPVRYRLCAHFLAAIWALCWLGALPSLSVFGYSIPTLLLYPGMVLYLIWLLNLYNFMDGIDGIASVEALTILFSFCLLSLLSGDGNIALPVLLAFAVAGFLYWNFPPARIFMGDAGSGFLGIMLGILSIQTSLQKPDLFWAWIILLGVFIVDATVTLIRRVLRKQKFYQAHRSHAYQYASRLYCSHRVVTLAVGVINLAFLFPLASLVVLGKLDGFMTVLLAYFPLTVLVIYYKAGAPDLQGELA